jgi:hypothetical protein
LAVVKKLLYKVLIHDTISSSLKYLREKHAILSVCWKNMIPTIAMESSNLNRRYAKGSPASSPKTDSFIAARLVNVNEMV